MENLRVKTGVQGYDMMLNGGYQPHSVNLISGCSGTGKTLFAVSFVYAGAVQFGERGVYITLEEEVSQIKYNCKSIGVDLDSAEAEKVSLFDVASLRKVYTTKEEFELDESPIDVESLIELIKRNADGVKRIAIDSLVPLSLKYKDMNEFRSELFRLRMTLKSLEATTILTTEIPHGSRDISRFGIEDFLADSVTILKPATEVGNYMRIHKIRGSDHIKDPVRYEVTRKGLRVIFDEF